MNTARRAVQTGRSTFHWPLGAILVLYLGLGALYSVVNPLFESPDEPWHWFYVKQIADGGGLPRSDLQSSEPWHQEGSQPPLFYLVAGAVTFWIDTSDAHQVVHFNPHAAMGHGDAFGNLNVLAHTQAEQFPWRGTVLSAHLVRLLSVLAGAGVVVGAYGLAWAVRPGDRVLATLAAALVAFNPQFLFIAASVNNGAWVSALCAAGLWLSLRFLRRGGSLPGAIGLGAVAGLAGLAQLAGLGLTVVVALAITWAAWQVRSLWRWLTWAGAALGSFAAVCGWWFVRNWILYRDPFGLPVMFFALGKRQAPPTLEELVARLEGVWRSMWAVFGWFNVLAPAWLYAAYTALAVVGVAGLVLLALRRRARQVRPEPVAFMLIWWGVMLALLWRWAQVRYPQGRLLFPALAALAVLVALGCLAWVPRRGQPAVAGTLAAGLLALAAWVPFGVIAPAYQPPPLLPLERAETLPHAGSIGFQEGIALRGWDVAPDSVQAGGTLTVTLYWQTEGPLSRAYSVFLHLVEEETGLIVAQRDAYPARGNRVTWEWPAGVLIPDPHQITVPATAPTPSRCRLVVGLYDYATGERLARRDEVGDAVTLTSVALTPRRSPEGIPNPLFVNFEDKIALVGFELDRRVLRPGETLQVDLYWRALSPVERDYTVFVHLMREGGEVWAGQDAQPQRGARPTSSWREGELIPDTCYLTLPTDAPPDVYAIEFGLYRPDTGKRLTVNFSDAGVILGHVRVLPAETTPEAAP